MTNLKVMLEKEACEFFIGARCRKMGSAKGLRWAGHLAFRGAGIAQIGLGPRRKQKG